MQIITPRLGETIKIDDGIEITVLGVENGLVRFNVQVPEGVRVHCEDIHPNIQAIHPGRSQPKH